MTRMKRILRALLVPVLAFSLTTVAGNSAKCQQGNPPSYLDQGWTPKKRQEWYSTSQGSRLLPEAWLRALEVAGSGIKFLSPENMKRLGYLPGPKPNDLPVGFVVDSAEEGFETPAVGMNCAACHTGELAIGGKVVRIDGAPALADFDTFMSDLLASLVATRDNESKFEAFAAAVLKNNTKGARAKLRADLDVRAQWYQKLATYNKSPAPYGYGRLDAQGHILNKISLVVGAPDQFIFSPADAPVSYPHIWNAHQHDRVQWNGVAENGPRTTIRGNTTDFGALGRNVGEALGVFAEIEIDKDWSLGYKSSVVVTNLIKLERLLMELRSPKWPVEQLGPIEGNVRLGSELFNARELRDYSVASGPKAKCVTCHHQLKSSDTTTKIEAQMQPVTEAGTDIWAACNTFLRESRSGNMQGRKEKIVSGVTIRDRDFTIRLLTNAVAGAIVYKYDQIADVLWKDLIYGRRGENEAPTTIIVGPEVAAARSYEVIKRMRESQCRAQPHELLRYKARPLNGIWATAPYLHNGSVLSLYDLLLPAKQRAGLELNSTKAGGAPRLRRDIFFVGSRDFDPKEVGLRSDSGPGRSEFRVRDASGKEIFGNSNAGHEWGAAELSDDERWALVAYLKSL